MPMSGNMGDIAGYVRGKRVLFVYGGGSVKKNGCYDDVKQAVSDGNGEFYELSGASRELSDIERGIKIVKDNDIEMIIGAGGAQIMDCSKLIAFGTCVAAIAVIRRELSRRWAAAIVVWQCVLAWVYAYLVYVV